LLEYFIVVSEKIVSPIAKVSLQRTITGINYLVPTQSMLERQHVIAIARISINAKATMITITRLDIFIRATSGIFTGNFL